jgi:voltage-gated sodium channel
MQTPQATAAPPPSRLQQILEHPATQRTIMALILINAVVLGLETSASVMAQAGGLLMAVDQFILAIFVVEIAARLVVHRWAFFKDPWSVFDFVVVVIALVPASGALSVLRALRVLRVLRLLTVVPSMRRVVGALLSALPGLSSIAGVLALLFYVFAVIATKLFGADFPDWFGNLGRSLYTLFQVMTLEGWSDGITRPVMEKFPYAWIFFLTFILISTFTILNLFIAVIVDAMQKVSTQDAPDGAAAVDPARAPVEADLPAQIGALRSEIAELKALIVARSGQNG